jgi:hypothetical protein
MTLLIRELKQFGSSMWSYLHYLPLCRSNEVKVLRDNANFNQVMTH